MFQQRGFLEIVRNFTHLIPCDLTLWAGGAILCTTRTHTYSHLKDWPIIEYAGKNPYGVFKSPVHPCCLACQEYPTCPYEQEFYVPFSESFHPGGGVCFQFRQGERDWLEAVDPENGLQLLLDYTFLLQSAVQNLENQHMMIRLEQQVNYLAELFPGGLILLDANDQIIYKNEAAKRSGWGHSLDNLKESFKRKEFIFDKSRLGACVHTPSQFVHQPSSGRSEQSSFPLPKLIGISPTLQKALDIAKQAARSDSTILIRGESGTGKEMFARTIHDTSPRSQGPFIAINCAAIPEGLLESELFGYEEGSFTGAKKGGKTGKIELANQGTLFLDEIGDMPFPLQAKLLRVIQEKRIDRIGSSESISVNIRLVAATHRPLEEMISQGKFREDLYFRLNVIPIFIPPLRERKEDIELLLNFYLRKYCTQLGKSYKKFSYTVLERLIGYSWPGNIRELENMVEYLVNIHDKDLITIEDLPLHPRLKPVSIHISAEQLITDSPPPRATVHGKVKKEKIITLLNQCGWDTGGKKKVANELGISIATLYRWLKKYKIEA